MHQQHNPIAQRIDTMCRLYTEKVEADTVLIRWLLEPEESRMYEGFCRLEASPHGSLDDVFLFFYTPFAGESSYSSAIMANWLQLYRQENEKAGLPDAIQEKWNYSRFEKAVEQEEATEEMLWEMMDDFRHYMQQPDAPVVLSLLPEQVSNPIRFVQWVGRMAAMPVKPGLRLLVLDYPKQNYFGEIFQQQEERAVTLHTDLKMDEAIRQIATAGDPQNPEVQFRQCMYRMSDAVRAGNEADLHYWGNKAVQTGIKAAQPMLTATAYITYAGILFSFKQHPRIMELLEAGLRVCQREMDRNNEAIRPLVLQYYGYFGAAWELQKKTEEAVKWFMKQGEAARNWGMQVESVSAFHKAWVMAEFKNLNAEADKALIAAAAIQPPLTPDQVRSCEYPYIAFEYLENRKHRNNFGSPETENAVNALMENSLGSDWRERVKLMKQNFNRQHIMELEAAAKVE